MVGLDESVDRTAEDGGFANAGHVAHAVQNLGRIRGGDLHARGARGIGIGQPLQLRDGADRDELRHVDVADAAAALGLVHVVRGDEEGDALAGELEEQIPQRAARDGIDAGGGLVEEDNLRRMDDGAGERQALFPSAGELAGAAIHVGLDAGEGLHLARALGRAIGREAVDAGVEVPCSRQPSGLRRGRTSATCSRRGAGSRLRLCGYPCRECCRCLR